MTKIYIYCLFDTRDSFMGVYSSLQAIHRDALRLANRGHSSVHMVYDNEATPPSLTALRNIFKGKCDIEVKYRTSTTNVRIYKTKLKE
tara:strand:+ start:1834 stop:2097 length:264 start_codon:yes stop_codon:yes gene_type:complete